jgi:hypothetical protein
MANEKLRRVFFRTEIVTKAKILDTKKCLAIGFQNLGSSAATINRVIQLPATPPVLPILFMPINENEKDATQYEVAFQPAVLGATFLLLVVYKEVYDVDYLPAYEK